MVCCRCSFPGQQLSPSQRHSCHWLSSLPQQHCCQASSCTLLSFWLVTHSRPLLSASSCCQPGYQGLQTLTQSMPTSSSHLESSNSGLPAGDTKVFSGVTFQGGHYFATATAAAPQRSSLCQGWVSPPQPSLLGCISLACSHLLWTVELLSPRFSLTPNSRGATRSPRRNQDMFIHQQQISF